MWSCLTNNFRVSLPVIIDFPDFQDKENTYTYQELSIWLKSEKQYFFRQTRYI